MNLNEANWAVLLAKLKEGSLADEEIGSTIVRLAKPLDPERIAAAEETVLSYSNHPNSWARHEVLWFITWAKLRNHKGILIRALQKDPNPDNRGFAALCLAHLLGRAGDANSVQALKARVLDENEERLVRLNSYGALLEIVQGANGSEFFSGSAGVDKVDLSWLGSLP